MEAHLVRFPSAPMVLPASMNIKVLSGVVATPSTPAFTVVIDLILILVIDMNERIKELAVQAQVLADKFQEQWKAGPSSEEFFHQKFAELIVVECAKVILETPVKYTEIDIMHIIRDNVKQHFGIKYE